MPTANPYPLGSQVIVTGGHPYTRTSPKVRQGTVIKVGRALVTVEYETNGPGSRTEKAQFRIEHGYENRTDTNYKLRIQTPEQHAEHERRAEALSALKEFGLRFDVGSTSKERAASTELLATLAAVITAHGNVPAQGRVDVTTVVVEHTGPDGETFEFTGTPAQALGRQVELLAQGIAYTVQMIG